MKKRFSVGFVSLGCPKNLVDTENMMAALGESVSITAVPDEADVVVINTCGFLAPAKKESMDTIGEFAERKRSGSLEGLVVAGCMTERYLNLMSDTYPEVDAFIKTGEFSKIKEVVERIQSQKALAGEDLRLKLIGESDQLQGHSEITDFVDRLDLKRSYAYVKISEGCNRVCSFCIIPKLRGKHHSRTIEGVVDEVRQLVAQGTKDIIFIAQDLTSYGRDLKDGTGLLELLRAVEDVEGEFWFRLMYNYPRFFSDELIDFLAQSQKFSGYVDMPLQHISDNVLRKMKRPESSEEIKALVQKLRKRIPHLSLRTTLMVGFPGETETDFHQLIDFIKDARFDHLGAFPFYPEEGTPAADLPDQVDESLKQKRFDKLMQVQQKVEQKNLKRILGYEVTLLIDSLAEKTRQGLVYRGRSSAQAPDIDGLTYVVSDQIYQPGDWVEAVVERSIGAYDLLAVDLNAQMEEFELPRQLFQT